MQQQLVVFGRSGTVGGTVAALLNLRVFCWLLATAAMLDNQYGFCLANDVFCGQLSVHRHSWPEQNTYSVGHRSTVDLKQCLQICCSINDWWGIEPSTTVFVTSPTVVLLNDLTNQQYVFIGKDTWWWHRDDTFSDECDGVTFVGVVEKNLGDDNCLMIGCRDECQPDNGLELSEGVSVRIARDPLHQQQNTTANGIVGTSSSSSSSSTGDHFPGSLLRAVTPVWTIGLVIVLSVFCIGLNIALISAYICWRRRHEKQKAQISSISALHAFNPS